MISSLTDLHTVATYLRRAGAEAVNFKSATLTETIGNYPKVVGWIKFHPDGVIEVSGEAPAPTPDEQAAILEEFKTADFPKPVTLSAIADAPPGCDLDDKNTFICHDFNDQIVMVHQRYETAEGHKGFLPWTRWSDGQWRKMEPDVMPFYGLPGAKEHSTLFIHEGSKAAKRVKAIIAGEDKGGNFPWLENVRWGHHIGWIGGVFALERSDWTRLAKMGWKRVYIVVDNDGLGRSIVPQIAEHFDCQVMSVMFTDDWPQSFDLGDDWPETLFGEEGQYIGQPFERCVQPTTWATNEIIIPPETPRGKPTTIYEIRESFAEQWSWIEKVDQMVNLELPHYRIPSAHFNSFIRPFSNTKDTLSAFHRRFSGNQMALTYDPSNDGTIVRNNAGLQAINLYQPSPVKAVQGDFSPFLNFMDYLIPKEEDRNHVLRWIATLRARPGSRMLFGILLMSENQGTGKGTLGRILADMVGRDNAAFPGESMIVNSEFNGWIEGKRLIVVDEIYSGHSWKAYNKLKPYVTDETIEVNVKHQATWSMPNWTHYLLMSNSRAALKIEQSDRRWLIPEVTENPWPAERFVEFNRWLQQGGLASIAYWAATFEKSGAGTYIRPGEIAPMTADKLRLINESRSEAEQLFINVAENMRDLEEPMALSIPALRTWAANRLEDRVYETPQAISRLLRNHGLWITDRVKVGGQKVSLAVNREEMEQWPPERLRECIQPPNKTVPDDF